MRLKNPTNLGFGFSVDLRDSRGRYSSLKNAKYFEIFYNGKTVLFDEFPPRLSQTQKLEILESYYQVLNAAQIEAEFKEKSKKLKKPTKKKPTKKPKKKPLPPEEEEPEYPEEEIEEELTEREKRRVIVPFKELQKLSKKEQDELSEALFTDLLQEISQTDEDTFRAIVEIPKAQFKKDKYEIKDIYSVLYDKFGTLEKYYSELKKPLIVDNKNAMAVTAYVREQIIPKFKKLYEKTSPGEDLFIARVTYDTFKEHKGKIIKEKQGIGISRTEAKDWKTLESFLEEMLIEKIGKELDKYLSRSANHSIEITGVTLENMVHLED